MGFGQIPRELKNHDIFNRDLAPPDALKICDSLLSYIHDTRRRRGRHYLCSAVKDVFVPFYERKLQVILGPMVRSRTRGERVLVPRFFHVSEENKSNVSGMVSPGEGFAELWVLLLLARMSKDTRNTLDRDSTWR